MKGEILDIETIKELAGDKKEIERLKRNCNLKELENKELVKKVTKLDIENHYLRMYKDAFELLETYLPHRINQITDRKDSRCDYAVLELTNLINALKVEKNKIENIDSKEVEENETE